MNYIYKKEVLIYLNKKALISCKENIFFRKVCSQENKCYHFYKGNIS